MINIQSQMKELFGNSCYAYCLSYMSGFRDLKTLTQFVLEHWMKGNIDNDGYVSQPQKIMNCKDVKKVPIEYLHDLPEGNWIVEYSYNNGSHFVVANKDGTIVFDPSGNSNSVKYGRPISYRKFIK